MSSNGEFAAPWTPERVRGDGDRARTGARPTRPEGRLWPTVAIGWALAAVVLSVGASRAIAHLWFGDPDDAMRLLEVRDWLGGQSWWDVSQHRLDHGDFAMHWSRLVDLPLAAVMALCDPLFGAGVSTRIAMVAVPLLTLLGAMALVAVLTRRLLDLDRARIVVLLTPLSVPLVFQLRPMRIDHHGWQVVFALAAVNALLARPSPRSGALAGALLATLLTISLEGLPITAAILGVGLLAAVFDPARRTQALAMAWSLFGTLIVLQGATRGPGSFAPACDAVAPAWIAAIGIAALGASAMLAMRMPVRARLAVLAASGAASLGSLQAMAPLCLRGPFATLDPLVYTVWYSNVAEGLPLWEEPAPRAILMGSFAFVGLVGSVFAWRAARGAARGRWTMMLGIAGAGFVLALLVERAGATASALALPGTAFALHALLVRARRIPALLPRVAATAAVMFVVTPGVFGLALLGDPGAPPADGAAVASPKAGALRRPCDHDRDMADLAQLPLATIFAPIDATPALLAWTRHRAIAGPYHRNSAAIRQVLATFLGSPQAARASVTATGAAYVVGCPGSNESAIYDRRAPNGFWARLERGERFDWLTPVVIPGSAVLVWRVTPSRREGLSGAVSKP